MAMESSFLNLIRGNRITSYMGLQVPTDAPKYGGGYQFVEVPVLRIEDMEGKVLEKGLRLQQIRVIPDCTVDLRGDFHLLVEPNRQFSDFGSVQGSYYIHPGEGRQSPSFSIILRRDIDITAFEHAVRLYLRV